MQGAPRWCWPQSGPLTSKTPVKCPLLDVHKLPRNVKVPASLTDVSWPSCIVPREWRSLSQLQEDHGSESYDKDHSTPGQPPPPKPEVTCTQLHSLFGRCKWFVVSCMIKCT